MLVLRGVLFTVNFFAFSLRTCLWRERDGSASSTSQKSVTTTRVVMPSVTWPPGTKVWPAERAATLCGEVTRRRGKTVSNLLGGRKKASWRLAAPSFHRRKMRGGQSVPSAGDVSPPHLPSSTMTSGLSFCYRYFNISIFLSTKLGLMISVAEPTLFISGSTFVPYFDSGSSSRNIHCHLQLLSKSSTYQYHINGGRNIVFFILASSKLTAENIYQKIIPAPAPDLK